MSVVHIGYLAKALKKENAFPPYIKPNDGLRKLWLEKSKSEAWVLENYTEHDMPDWQFDEMVMKAKRRDDLFKEQASSKD